MGKALPLGSLMIDLLGTTLTPEEAEILQHPHVGGIILFSRNYENKAQLKHLITQIHQARPNLLIGVDQEGGRVQRFKTDFTLIPPAATYGKTYAKDPNYSRKHAYEAAKVLASELVSVGVDFSFAPVLDLASAQSAVIGDRSFHADIDIVIDLAKAFIQGLHAVGMASVGKHFPGHGSVIEDTHTQTVEDARELSAIEAYDIKPFAELTDYLTAIMPAHIIYTQVDQRPAGFSPYWLGHILRQKLGFQGAIISDDLNMHAGSFFTDPLTRAQAALEAGCDMILYCNQPNAVIEILDQLQWQPHPDTQRRLLSLKLTPGRSL